MAFMISEPGFHIISNIAYGTYLTNVIIYNINHISSITINYIFNLIFSICLMAISFIYTLFIIVEHKLLNKMRYLKS